MLQQLNFSSESDLQLLVEIYCDNNSTISALVLHAYLRWCAVRTKYLTQIVFPRIQRLYCGDLRERRIVIVISDNTMFIFQIKIGGRNTEDMNLKEDVSKIPSALISRSKGLNSLKLSKHLIMGKKAYNCIIKAPTFKVPYTIYFTYVLDMCPVSYVGKIFIEWLFLLKDL